MKFSRRNLIKSAATLPLVAVLPSISFASPMKSENLKGIKLSLNAYSFNEWLRSGKIDLLELIDYCVEVGFDALDPTGYYFPEYPEAPTDSFLYEFKRKAYLNGVEISGSGVRNDFTNQDPSVRKEGVTLVKRWIDVCVKMGCPLLRVFAGKELEKSRSRKITDGLLIGHLKEVSDYASKKGILLALQNHNEYIKTAEQAITILNAVGSPWLGLHLDIGSFQEKEAYSEIEKAIPYAFTWQIKEEVYENGKKVKTDLERILQIINKHGYRGYLPLETLGKGDPAEKVKKLIEEMRLAMEKLRDRK